MLEIAVISIAYTASLVSFALLAKWYWMPRFMAAGFVAALTPILLLHSFRHLGMMYLVPGVVPGAPPDAFVQSTAWGDFVTMLLAFAALAAVRMEWGSARTLVWVFNVVGFVDLMIAGVQATRVQLIQYEIGVAYLLPAIVVPLLLVTHVMVFIRLLKEPTPATS